MPDPREPEGYFEGERLAFNDAGVVYVSDLRLNSVFKFADVTTTTVSSTWGRLKVLYR